MMHDYLNKNVLLLLGTDVLCTDQPESSGQKESTLPALTGIVSELASLHRCGRSAQLLRPLGLTPQGSEPPVI